MIRSRSIKRTATRLYVKSRRLGRRLRRSRHAGRFAAAAAVLAVAFAAVVWIAVPYWAGGVLARWAAAEPGRTADTQRISVNPFSLRMTLDGVRIGTPSFDLVAERVALDFDLATLLGKGVALDELIVERPRLQLGAPSPAAGGPEARADGRAEPLSAFEPPYPLRIDAVAVTDGRIEWIDSMRSADPLRFDGVTVQASSIDSTSAAPGRFDVYVRDTAGGVLRIDGTLSLGRGMAEGRVSAENIDAAEVGRRSFEWPSGAGSLSGAADFEWHRDENRLRLHDASVRTIRPSLAWPDGTRLDAAGLEATGDVELVDGELSVAGRVELQQAELREPSGDTWLEADRLAAVDASGNLRTSGGPDGVRTLALAAPAWAEALTLSGLRTRVTLDDSGDAENRALDAALSALTMPRPSANLTTEAQRAGALAVGRIDIQNGTLDIVDADLDRVAPAAFRFSDVEGVLARAQDDGRAAGRNTTLSDLVANFEGELGEAGTAALVVRAAPVDEGFDREVMLQLRDVPAGELTRDAERLTGRSLEAGFVDAELNYAVENGNINGAARLQARGLEIGLAESDEDETIRLALALLEDRHDSAAIAVRFSGSDAGSSVDELLAPALLARLAEVAAAPFAALGEAAGVDGASLEAVSFPPGQAAPAARELESIAALTEALRSRPQVGLQVRGVADRALDRDALAAAQIELHVTLATAGPSLVARPQPVDFDSPRHRDVLEEFSGERLSDERRETIASYFTRDSNGRVADAERSAYYRALFDALVDNESIPDSGLERLGRYRARALADGLIEAGIAEERIEIIPAVVQASAGPAPSEAAPLPRSEVEVPLDVFALPRDAQTPAPSPPSASPEIEQGGTVGPQ